MTTDQPVQGAEATGHRVRVVRKLRGLTQEQLANRAHMSPALVRAVEQGRKAASPYFVSAVARALEVSVPELHGLTRPAPVSTTDVAELETAVMSGNVIAADGLPFPLDDLASRSRRLLVARQRAQFSVVVTEMPALLADVHNAVLHHVGDERRRAWQILAQVHQTSAIALFRLGSEVAALTTEAGVRAAEQADDPVYAAVIGLGRCDVLMRRGAYAAVSAIAHEARLSFGPAQLDTVASRSGRGHAHLRSAIAIARAGDLESSDAHVAEARRLAGRVPPGADLLGTFFNADNVTIHDVACAVEAGDGEGALRRQDALVAVVTPSRLGQHHVDLARAHLLLGRRDATLTELSTARETAPQLTRHHPHVHEAVRELAGTDRRRTDSLADFARWAGVAV